MQEKNENLTQDAFFEKIHNDEELKKGFRVLHPQAEVYVVSGFRTMIATVHFLTFSEDFSYVRLNYKGNDTSIFLQFLNDPNRNDSFMTSQRLSGKMVLLSFTNFDSSLSVWNQSAYPIGEIGSYPLFVRAKITLPPANQGYREILMTFYVEDAVPVTGKEELGDE